MALIRYSLQLIKAERGCCAAMPLTFQSHSQTLPRAKGGKRKNTEMEIVLSSRVEISLKYCYLVIYLIFSGLGFVNSTRSVDSRVSSKMYLLVLYTSYDLRCGIFSELANRIRTIEFRMHMQHC